MLENDINKKILEKSLVDFEDAKAQLKIADTLVENYNNPVVHGILNALIVVKKVPIIGDMIKSGISTTLIDTQKITRDRFLSIILSEEQNITPDMVNDVEFIVNFARVMEAVNRLARNEKIVYFANLIKNGYLTKNITRITNDEFEEYLYEISMLSFRELEYLAFIWKFAENYDGKVPSYQWKNFTDRFKEKFNGQDPNHICRKLTKTGLIYEIKMGSYPSPAFIEFHLDNEGYAFDKDFKRFYEVVLDSDY